MPQLQVLQHTPNKMTMNCRMVTQLLINKCGCAHLWLIHWRQLDIQPFRCLAHIPGKTDSVLVLCLVLSGLCVGFIAASISLFHFSSFFFLARSSSWGPIITVLKHMVECRFPLLLFFLEHVRNSLIMREYNCAVALTIRMDDTPATSEDQN